MDLGEKLCLACGMCCDGALFDNVQLGPEDNADSVKALGLPVKLSRAKVPVAFFRQPCRALCADLKCQVYENRPKQCRTFECRVFKDVQAGRISFEAGHRLVMRGRRRADNVRRLLRKLGDSDERSSLGIRFRRMQRRLESEDISETSGGLFADLGFAMHKLDMLAHDKFYTSAEEI